MRAYPAWVLPDGMPRSWRHYLVGMHALQVQEARANVQQFNVKKVAGAKQEHADRWLDEQHVAARWRYPEGHDPLWP